MCGTVVAGFGAAGPEGELDDAGAVGAAAADICNIRVGVGGGIIQRVISKQGNN